MNSVTDEHLKVALQAVDAAREITLKYFRQPLDIIQKLDDSPVTIADRETEHLIRGIIETAFPDHGFYGEETGQTDIDKDWTWVVDPIDGTASFSTGKPTFGTLIALCYRGKPQLGIIDHAALDDRWIGIKGKQTTYNGKPVKANPNNTELANATAYTTTPRMFTQETLKRYHALADQCKFTIFGADCMAYGLVASGFTDLIIEADLKPYDYMAATPVIEGAGGVITDWQGREITLNTGDQILAAANPQLHKLALLSLSQESVRE